MVTSVSNQPVIALSLNKNIMSLRSYKSYSSYLLYIREVRNA